jgi:carboxypeptidase Taq
MSDPQADLEALRRRLAEIEDLRQINYVLVWDQMVWLPPGAAEGRGQQSALLERLAHERAADPALGELIERLHEARGRWDEGSDEAALIEVARRDHARVARIPAEFVERRERHIARIYPAWAAARPANDFAAVRPLLEESVALSREYASFFPEAAHPADAHIAESDHGASAAWVRDLFARLRGALVPLVEAVCAQPSPEVSFLRQRYDRGAQLAFGEMVIRRLGYDLSQGRQDLTHHPFMIRLGAQDVRITTRVREDDVTEALFSTIHEAGHALYEQGVAPALARGPLGQGTSSGLHESQSRLWENLVGRSLPFWEYFFPRLQGAFPAQLGEVSLEAFYRGINRVERSLIRTDADELTYNLHVMIRFELELQLLEGSLPVSALPEAWHAAYEASLGLRAPDDRDGVLQDVHWFSGLLGGNFQGYTLGNVMSAQLMAAARRARPALDEELRAGDFGGLLGWLREHVHGHGRKRPALEVMERATGAPLGLEDYLAYLRGKYGALYGV